MGAINLDFIFNLWYNIGMKFYKRLAVICVVMFVGIGAAACGKVKASEAEPEGEITGVSVKGVTGTYTRTFDNENKVFVTKKYSVEVVGTRNTDLVSYRLNEGDFWSEYNKAFDEVGTYTVYVCVERAGCEPFYGSADVVINPLPYGFDESDMFTFGEIWLYETAEKKYIGESVWNFDIAAELVGEFRWHEDQTIFYKQGWYYVWYQHNPNFEPVKMKVYIRIFEY